MKDQYNTKLNPQEEKEFIDWATKNNRLNDNEDYDMRGAFKEMKDTGANLQSSNGHFPDTYKKPNHPTFSSDSKYNGVDGYKGGAWGVENGKDVFQPSETNLKNMGGFEGMKQYFKKVEPNAILKIY